jgi:diguanylate cyclase (GGDEF)-like protein
VLKKLRAFIIKIPAECRQEYLLEMCRSNLLRAIIIASLILLICATVFIFHRQDAPVSRDALLIEMSFNLFFVPVAVFLYRRQHDISDRIICAVLGFYVFNMLVTNGVFSIMRSQGATLMIMYIIALFVAATVLFFSARQLAVLFASTYLIFYFVVPFFQPAAVSELRTTALAMNVMGFVISRLSYRDRIIYYLEKRLIQEKNETLEALAVRDSMTGLLNHETIYFRLEREIENVRLRNATISVAMLDIDRFKSLNDTYGHQEGDEIIIRIAQILKDTCRAKDIIGRYGGEEFMIISPDTDISGMYRLVDRIREKIGGIEFNNGVHITISVGVSELGEQTSEQLIKSADDAMYAAKRNGRNRVEGPPSWNPAERNTKA